MLLTGKDRDVGEVLVKSLQNMKYSINEKLENSFINFFGQKPKLSSEAVADAQGTHKDKEHDSKIETLDIDQPGKASDAGLVGEDNNEMDSDGSESSDQDEAGAMLVGEASSSDDKDGDANDSKATPGDYLKEQIEFHDGRRRRRTIFGNDVDQIDVMVSFMLVFVERNHASLILIGNKLACIMVVAFQFFQELIYIGSSFFYVEL